MNLPAKGTIGTLLNLEILITKKNSGDQAAQEIEYEIDHSEQWALIGKLKSKISLSYDSPATFSLELLPLCTGWISVPSILLRNVCSYDLLIFGWI